MASEAELEKLLSDGDWGAVKTAQALGQAAWPTLEKGSRMADYRSRQITMACAGRLGGAHAASILVAGLADSFINVRLAAAGQLSGSPPPHALDGILDVLTTSSEDDVCQLLALAAGRLPSSRTTRVLLSVAPRQDAVGENAQLALAKLGNQEYIQAHLVKLSSDAPLSGVGRTHLHRRPCSGFPRDGVAGRQAGCPEDRARACVALPPCVRSGPRHGREPARPQAQLPHGSGADLLGCATRRDREARLAALMRSSSGARFKSSTSARVRRRCSRCGAPSRVPPLPPTPWSRSAC